MALFSPFLFLSLIWGLYINGHQYATWQPAKEDGPPWEEPERGDKNGEHPPKPLERIHPISGVGQTDTTPLSLSSSPIQVSCQIPQKRLTERWDFYHYFFLCRDRFQQRKKGVDLVWSGQVSVLFSDLDSGQFLENPIIGFFFFFLHSIWMIGFDWFWVFVDLMVGFCFRHLCEISGIGLVWDLRFEWWGYSLCVRVSVFFYFFLWVLVMGFVFLFGWLCLDVFLDFPFAEMGCGIFVGLMAGFHFFEIWGFVLIFRFHLNY